MESNEGFDLRNRSWVIVLLTLLDTKRLEELLD
jgi:hypothetical protein